MSKLLELGYPRHPAMKNLVPHVLDRIQAGAATGRAVDEGVTQIWKTKTIWFLRLLIIRVSFCRHWWLLDHDRKLLWLILVPSVQRPFTGETFPRRSSASLIQWKRPLSVCCLANFVIGGFKLQKSRGTKWAQNDSKWIWSESPFFHKG